MGMDNLVLYVATYDDTAAATEDYKALKAAEASPTSRSCRRS